MNNLQEDIHLGNLHIDLDRLHQKIDGDWKEIHTFAVDELKIKKNGIVIKTIKMGYGK